MGVAGGEAGMEITRKKTAIIIIEKVNCCAWFMVISLLLSV